MQEFSDDGTFKSNAFCLVLFSIKVMTTIGLIKYITITPEEMRAFWWLSNHGWNSSYNSIIASKLRFDTPQLVLLRLELHLAARSILTSKPRSTRTVVNAELKQWDSICQKIKLLDVMAGIFTKDLIPASLSLLQWQKYPPLRQ